MSRCQRDAETKKTHGSRHRDGLPELSLVLPRSFRPHRHPSRRTPLNFLAAAFSLAGFLTAMNSPPFLLRLVQAVAPASFVFSCERFFTAPFRALSPIGLLVATEFSLVVVIYRDPTDFLSIGIQNRDMPRSGRMRIFDYLTGDDSSAAHRFAVVSAINPRWVDQMVTVGDVKKVAWHF
jgi:hypothetical protein